MNRKTDFDNQEDPYQVIRRLRAAMEQQKAQIDQYELICNSLTYEKNAAMQQASHLKRQVESLSERIQQQQLVKSRTSTNLTLTQTKILPKQNRQYFTTYSPQVIKSDIILPIHSPVESKVNLEWKSKEFIPGQVIFKKRENKINNHGASFISGESSSENIMENVGDYLIEDFMVTCPQILQLKRLRESKREEKQFTLFEYYSINFNKMYKNKKAQYLKQVQRRAFPLGARAWRKTIDDYEKFKKEMDVSIGETMNQNFFIFNLKGDFADGQRQKNFLGNSNPFKALFAVCLRVPDFIPIRQQKSYQKRQQQVWMVDKVYTILTYFPFFHIHISLLSKVHKILQPVWFKLQKQEILSRNLQRNLTETLQNSEVNKIVNYALSKKPEFGQPCVVDNHYFGCLPVQSQCEYYIARFTCPIFFSTFAYEEMLLLMTAMFMQKTIIFVSKSQSASTLCSLFLTTVLAPFRYNQHLIINCDQQKIDNIVFEFPFILVVSIKKDANFNNVLKMFIDSNCDRFKGFSGKDQTGPLIMVDIDSNSIFYDSMLNKKFEQLIVEPSESQLRQAYLEVNATVSKSFTFPRKMPVQMMGRSKNFYQKNEQQRRKLLKQYQQKIDNNTSKWPTYSYTSAHEKLFNLLTDYIRSFSITPSSQHQLIKSTANNSQFRKEAARRHLHDKHPFHEHLVDVLVESQLFADYLDELDKQLEKKR